MKLAKLTDYAVIVACVAVVAHFGETYYAGTHRQARSLTYQVGDKLASTADLSFGRSRQTLLLYTATTCHFCKESMPFYRKMTAAAHDRGIGIIGISSEALDANSTYLKENGVEVDKVVSVAANKLRVVATPTLIIVGQDGTVKNVWVGKIPDDHEQEVLKAITSL